MTLVACRARFVCEFGSDRSDFITERHGGAILSALLEFSVVVVRGMELRPAEHVALTRMLGEPEVVTDMRNHHPESLDILVISNGGSTPVVGNQCWHSDRSFLPEPTRYTILRADVVPATGGDTLFADMVSAYREVPVGWRSKLAGAIGVHSYDKIAALRARVHNKPLESDYNLKYPPVRHPAVRAHPETGTPALYVSDLCLARVESSDGAELGISVGELVNHATDAKFVYRHRWRPRDVLIWDNARVVHRAAELPPDLPRVMHRTTTAGETPLPAFALGPEAGAW